MFKFKLKKNILELKNVKRSNQQKLENIFFSEWKENNQVFNLAGTIELVNHDCSNHNAK